MLNMIFIISHMDLVLNNLRQKTYDKLHIKLFAPNLDGGGDNREG